MVSGYGENIRADREYLNLNTDIIPIGHIFLPIGRHPVHFVDNFAKPLYALAK